MTLTAISTLIYAAPFVLLVTCFKSSTSLLIQNNTSQLLAGLTASFRS